MAKEERSKVKFWERQLHRADHKRGEFEERFRWKRIKELWDTGAQTVRLDAESTSQKTESLSTSSYCNWVWAFGQTFIPAVYWRHPKIHIYPKRSKDQVAGELVQPLINEAFRETHFRQACRRALQDTLIYGHGWVKLGWYTRFGQVPPGRVDKSLLEGTQKSLVDTDMYLLQDSAYAYRVSPERIYVDPEAACYEEIRWMAQEYYWPLEEVKSDPFLKNTKNVNASIFEEGHGEKGYYSSHPPDNKDEGRWVRVFEIWDRIDKKVYVWCQGSEKWNREMSWPYKGLNGFPFKYLTVTEAVDDLYPPSTILPWLALVEELSAIRAIRLDHLRKMVHKWVARPGAMSAKQKLMFCDPYNELCEVDDPEGLAQFKGLAPDANLYACEDKIKEDIREISGFSEILSGSLPFSRISATGSAIMERNATLRFDHYSERVAEFIVDCAKDLFKIIRDYQDEGKTVMIVGKPNPQWVEFTRDAIEGEFFFDIDVEDMAIASKQARIKESYDALVALAPFQEVRRGALIQDLLLAFGKTDLTNYMNPPEGPPLDPQFENEVMTQGVPVQPTTNEDHQAHLAVHGQFMQTRDYLMAIQQIPQVAAIFSEHMQVTLKMFEQLQMQVSQPRAGVSSSSQRGSANVTSQRPQGAGPNALSSAMGRLNG